MKLDEHFLAQMREATQLVQTSGPAAATAAIQRALQGGSGATGARVRKTPAGGAPPLPHRAGSIDPTLPVVDNSHAAIDPEIFRKPLWRKTGATTKRQAGDVEVVDADFEVDCAAKGTFLAATCTNPAGTRAYKVYVPSKYNGQALPLIVMLHGCKQNPDDFAMGTGMNAIAEQNDCFVAYPAQAYTANGSNCWNWFKTHDQQRERGEPSIIADITREVIRKYHIDPSRVYVAGLSAGGAMAAIMGATYPELYAAIGIHSGLPVGAAHDLPTAFAAMKNGGATQELRKVRRAPIPVIVFHGDCDTTVHPRNGAQALAQCIGRTEREDVVEDGKVPHGRSFTKTVKHDCDGKVIAEQWIVHGAGHAWSGGSSNGSYTDPKGPNAAREMLRFFSMQVQRRP